MRSDNLIGLILVVLAIAFALNSYLLHRAHSIIDAEKITKEQLRKEIYAELDSMAWTLQVDENRRYVLKQDHVFRCEVLIEELKRFKEGYYKENN